jgi:hypothetical protein
MDDLEAQFRLNREKATEVLSSYNNTLSLFIISFVSVFIPISVTVSTNMQEFQKMAIFLIMFFYVLLIPLLVFLVNKYREYRFQYEKFLIMSIIANYYKTPCSIAEPTFDELTKHIMKMTSLQEKPIMILLNSIYPEEFKNAKDFAKKSKSIMSR